MDLPAEPQCLVHSFVVLLCKLDWNLVQVVVSLNSLLFFFLHVVYCVANFFLDNLAAEKAPPAVDGRLEHHDHPNMDPALERTPPIIFWDVQDILHLAVENVKADNGSDEMEEGSHWHVEHEAVKVERVVERLGFLVEIEQQILVRKVSKSINNGRTRVQNWRSRRKHKAAQKSDVKVDVSSGHVEIRSRVNFFQFILHKAFGVRNVVFAVFLGVIVPPVPSALDPFREHKKQVRDHDIVHEKVDIHLDEHTDSMLRVPCFVVFFVSIGGEVIVHNSEQKLAFHK